MGFRHNAVQWQLGETTVYGTLTIPDSRGPFPAVVMVAGSGPTDRDWNSPLLAGTNGSGRRIAEALAAAGFASLRYDKRGAGPHARENLPHLLGRVSMASHHEELASAVSMLATHPDVRSDRVFGLGHSEGALHVLRYVLGEPPVPLCGVILLAPPGRPVGEVARAQLARQVSALPDGDTLLARYDAGIARFLAGQPVAPDPALPQSVQDLLRSLEAPANLPFARELWMADTTALLRAVDLPVLLMIGKKDIQVDWQADGAPLVQTAAACPDVTAVFPDNADHMFNREIRDRAELSAADVAQRYNADDAQLDPVSLRTMVEWLSAHLE